MSKAIICACICCQCPPPPPLSHVISLINIHKQVQAKDQYYKVQFQPPPFPLCVSPEAEVSLWFIGKPSERKLNKDEKPSFGTLKITWTRTSPTNEFPLITSSLPLPKTRLNKQLFSTGIGIILHSHIVQKRFFSRFLTLTSEILKLLSSLFFFLLLLLFFLSFFSFLFSLFFFLFFCCYHVLTSTVIPPRLVYHQPFTAILRIKSNSELPLVCHLKENFHQLLHFCSFKQPHTLLFSFPSCSIFP